MKVYAILIHGTGKYDGELIAVHISYEIYDAILTGLVEGREVATLSRGRGKISEDLYCIN